MENKYRQVTGLKINNHSDLGKAQVALDAESPFRYHQHGAQAWTRVEDNALRLVCRVYPADDWKNKTAEWAELCRIQRSSKELVGRWKILKVQEDCDPNDPTSKLPLIS